MFKVKASDISSYKIYGQEMNVGWTDGWTNEQMDDGHGDSNNPPTLFDGCIIKPVFYI